MRTQHRSQARAGFTLIEMMVVIGIIILLVALISAAVFMMFGSQQGANTATGLKLISNKANTQWRNVSDLANKDNSAQATTWMANWTTNNPNQLPTAARAAYVQAMLAQAFPTTFSQALNPNNGLPAYPAYQTYLAGLGVTGSSSGTQSIEASVCLLMILTKGPYNTGSDPDSFGGANMMTVTAGGISAQGFVDGFQTPLAANRTSTGLVIQSAGADRTMNTADDLYSNNLP